MSGRRSQAPPDAQRRKGFTPKELVFRCPTGLLSLSRACGRGGPLTVTSGGPGGWAMCRKELDKASPVKAQPLEPCPLPGHAWGQGPSYL